jgi:hypothetical protein
MLKILALAILGLAVSPAMAQTYYAERNATLDVVGTIEYFNTVPTSPYDYYDSFSGVISITDYGWTDAAMAYFTLDATAGNIIAAPFGYYLKEEDAASGSGVTGSASAFMYLFPIDGYSTISVSWPGGGTENQLSYNDIWPYPDATYGYNATFTTTSYTETETLFNADGGVFRTFSFPGAPEPPTWAMLLLGFAGLGFAGYRWARAGRALAA